MILLFIPLKMNTTDTDDTASPNLEVGFEGNFWTSYQLTTLTGIAPCQFHNFRLRGLLKGYPRKKGLRTVYDYDLFQVLKFLLSPESGEFRFKVQTVGIDQIHLDPSLQLRPKFRDSSLNEMVNDIKKGDRFPPLVVVLIGGIYYLVSGHKRKRSYELAIIPKVAIQVLPGGIAEAEIFASRDNQTLGDRPKGLSARAEVRKHLDQHPKVKERVLSGLLSHRKYAEHYGRSEGTVRRAFRDLINLEGTPAQKEAAARRALSGQRNEPRKVVRATESFSEETIDDAREFLRLTTKLETEFGMKGDKLLEKIKQVAGHETDH